MVWGLAIPAAVVVVTVLAYLPTFENGFVEWYDHTNLRFNESYRGLGWTQLRWQIAADRYGYLPCLGWTLLAAAGLGAGWLHLRRTRPLSGAAWRILPIVLVLSACLGALTWRQVGVWHDTETLWTQAVSRSPSAVAHVNLGDPLEGRGRIADAVTRYEEAIRLRPSYGPAVQDRRPPDPACLVLQPPAGRRPLKYLLKIDRLCFDGQPGRSRLSEPRGAP